MQAGQTVAAPSDVAGMLAYWLAVFPRRDGEAADQAALARAFWGVVRARDWITVEVLAITADIVVAECKWLPTPAEFLAYATEGERRLRREASTGADVPALEGGETLLLDVIEGRRTDTETAHGLHRAIEAGMWDRGTAQGRLVARHRRSPTTGEIDGELRAMATVPAGHQWSAKRGRTREVVLLRGTLDAALSARLPHLAAGYD